MQDSLSHIKHWFYCVHFITTLYWLIHSSNEIILSCLFLIIFIFLDCVDDSFKYLLQYWVSGHEFSFCLLWKPCISPSFMKDSFVGKILYIYSYFLSGFRIHHSILSLLLEFLLRYLVIFMFLSLYIPCCFSLAAFNILSSVYLVF
jgi:hypothetical protein